jgi:hypothetical protein
MGVGLRTTSKAVEEPPNPKARAPRIYPDNRTSSLSGGRRPALRRASSDPTAGKCL